MVTRRDHHDLPDVVAALRREHQERRARAAAERLVQIGQYDRAETSETVLPEALDRRERPNS